MTFSEFRAHSEPHDKEWKVLKFSDRKKTLTLFLQLEGQVWLTLYQLLMHPEAQRKYEYTSYRKSQIMNLRKYFNEVRVGGPSSWFGLIGYLISKDWVTTVWYSLIPSIHVLMAGL